MALCLHGHWPLFTARIVAEDLSTDQTAHTHTFDGVDYYMPNVFDGNIHGTTEADCPSNAIRPPASPPLESSPPGLPPPPAVPGGVKVLGDPHLLFAGGRRADFRGVPGKHFALVSAPRLAVNVRIEKASFAYVDAVIHGTYMTELIVRCGDTLMVHNATNATQWGFGWTATWIRCCPNGPIRYVYPHTKHGCSGSCDSHDDTRLDPDVNVKVEYATATLKCGDWTIRSTVQPVARFISGFSRNLDIKVNGPESLAHGIVGQNLDARTSRDGRMDNYPTSGEYTTVAQAEGAIEGEYSDYMLSAADATSFKYSRFSHLSSLNLTTQVGEAFASADFSSEPLNTHADVA